jgi:hypothetical protein
MSKDVRAIPKIIQKPIIEDSDTDTPIRGDF